MTVPLSLLTDLCLSSTHRNKSDSIDEPEMGEGQEQVFPAHSNVKEQPFAGQPLAAHPLLFSKSISRPKPCPLRIGFTSQLYNFFIPL